MASKSSRIDIDFLLIDSISRAPAADIAVVFPIIRPGIGGNQVFAMKYKRLYF